MASWESTPSPDASQVSSKEEKRNLVVRSVMRVGAIAINVLARLFLRGKTPLR